jgi:hypothetical protein
MKRLARRILPALQACFRLLVVGGMFAAGGLYLSFGTLRPCGIFARQYDARQFRRNSSRRPDQFCGGIPIWSDVGRSVFEYFTAANSSNRTAKFAPGNNGALHD